MADSALKAAGYIQVKLIPADRNGQTWSGWSQRWVNVRLVSEDSGRSKRDKIPEVWLEVRKKKSKGKPIKLWTVDSKDTLLYRCSSKSKPYAFCIQYKGENLVYLSGNVESESYDWMKIVRDILWPSQLSGLTLHHLIEASVIDNTYSKYCGMLGKYGHLSCQSNKLILFDNNGVNVIQEWYLHTIRKLQVFKGNKFAMARILRVYLGENSSTGCGEIYFYCPRAVSLLEHIRASIKNIFTDIGDSRKAQQASLMSLGALHDVTLDQSETRNVLETLIISDEIIKAKQEASQSIRPRIGHAAVEEARNKHEPFVWKDNELYDEEADNVSVKADYTPPDEEPVKPPRRSSLTQSLTFLRRPRANSCTPQTPVALESAKVTTYARRGSLPQSGRNQQQISPEISEKEIVLQLQRFEHILNLAKDENSEQIFPVVRNLKSHSSSEVREVKQAACTLSALDECSEETTSLSTSLNSVNIPLIGDDENLLDEHHNCPRSDEADDVQTNPDHVAARPNESPTSPKSIREKFPTKNNDASNTSWFTKSDSFSISLVGDIVKETPELESRRPKLSDNKSNGRSLSDRELDSVQLIAETTIEKSERISSRDSCQTNSQQQIRSDSVAEVDSEVVVVVRGDDQAAEPSVSSIESGKFQNEAPNHSQGTKIDTEQPPVKPKRSGVKKQN